jgi:hypothetical protein
MASRDVKGILSDIHPCCCGGVCSTVLKVVEETIYYKLPVVPSYNTRYAIYCESCGREVSSNTLNVAVKVWNNSIKNEVYKC